MGKNLLNRPSSLLVDSMQHQDFRLFKPKTSKVNLLAALYGNHGSTSTAAAKQVFAKGSLMLVSAVCLFGSTYVHAEEVANDPAAEIARLKQKLEEAQQENEALKNALVNAPEVTTNKPANAATPSGTGTTAAAEAPEATKEPEVEAKNLSEVVVTSRRKEEKLQDVPIPISVVGGKNIERDRTYDVQDLTKRAPGLTATTPNARRTGISIRGIGKASGNDSMEPAVGVVVDDVYLSHVGMSYQDFTDLDRIEVMRGPQGTLMGKNTTMGVLNYVSKAPTFSQQATVEGEVGGNQQTGILPGAFKIRSSYSNGLIDDLLAFRGSMYIDNQDGDIHNINAQSNGSTINERNRYGGRLQFLLTPTDKIRFRFNADYAEGKEFSNVKPAMFDPVTFADGTLRTANNGLTFSSRLSRDYFGGYQPIIGSRSWNEDDLGQVKPLLTKNGGVSGKLDWDIGPGTLTSVTAYRQLHFDANNDSDETKFDISVGGTLVDTKQYSEELRYAWSPFKWLDNQTGTFLMHTQTDSLSRTTYGQDAGAFYATNARYGALAANQGLLKASLNGLASKTLTTPWTDSVAFFDQANIHFTDKATLTLGVRETFESKGNGTSATLTNVDGSAVQAIANGGTAGEITAANGIRSDQKLKQYNYRTADGVDQWSTSWLANPSYKVNDDLMVYASVSGGEKSSSIQFNSNGGTIYVKPEKTLDFELGAKSLFFDKKVMLNTNLYHTTVTDYQATTNVADPTQVTGYRSQLGNIPGIEAMGVEIDSAYYPTSYLSFNVGGNYNHAVYSDWKTATCPTEINAAVCDNTGKQIVGAPELTGIFGVDLHKPLGVYGLTGHAWANTVVRTAQNLEANLSQYGKQDAYQVTDIGVGLLAGSKNRYEVNLVANNVFDTQYTTSINNFSNTGAVGFDGIGARRYVGLLLRTNF